MAGSGAAAFTIAVLLAATALVAVDAAIGCNAVLGDISGCMAYARGGGTPSSTCCRGLRTLNGQAATSADRQDVCRCLKKLLAGVPGLRLDNVAALPGKCGVNVPYPIRPTTDCSRVH